MRSGQGATSLLRQYGAVVASLEETGFVLTIIVAISPHFSFDASYYRTVGEPAGFVGALSFSNPVFSLQKPAYHDQSY
jgi:hypothetical protein